MIDTGSTPLGREGRGGPNFSSKAFDGSPSTGSFEANSSLQSDRLTASAELQKKQPNALIIRILDWIEGFWSSL
jgi:hypothetical protein